MEIYLVGGAVRDKLLNYPSHEKDWVVVGGTPQQMIAQGYRQVGKDFPVFLHPKTHDEYALARTERKTGQGYTGFSCHSSPDITLEQDLLRRDLTINAMAENEQGEIIDPYGGQQDLSNRVLRHVSDAFSEDPLRILRVARFAARYHHLGFKIAAETMQLLEKMVREGQAEHLVPERIWQELSAALSEQNPAVFFHVLKRCGALAVIFPELEPVFSNPVRQPPLALSVQTCDDTAVCFAVLTHRLDTEINKTLALIDSLTARLRAPNNFIQLARLTARYFDQCIRAASLDAQSLFAVLESTDALRKPGRFEQILLACQIIDQGNNNSAPTVNGQACVSAELLRAALDAVRKYDVKKLTSAGLKGKALGERLRIERIAIIDQLLRATG